MKKTMELSEWSASAYPWSRILSHYDLKYEMPSLGWTDSFMIGNGSLWALQYEHDFVFPEWTLNHCAIWYSENIKRTLLSQQEIDGIIAGKLPFRETFQKEKDSEGIHPYDSPSPKYGGQLRLAFGKPICYSPGHRITKQLKLQNAAIETKLDKHLSHPRIESLVLAGTDVFVAKVRKVSAMVAFQNEVQLFRVGEEALAPAETHAEGPDMWLIQRLPNQKYCLRVRVLPKGQCEYQEMTRKIFDPAWQSCFKPSAQVACNCRKGYCFCRVKGDFDILATIVVSEKVNETAESVAERAAKKLDEAQDNLSRLEQEHQRFWQNFWKKHYVDLGDDFLNRLWYLSNYHLGAVLGGRIHPGICGSWLGPSPELKNMVPWRGNYTFDYNAELPVMPLMQLNRPEIALPSFRMIARMLPEARKITRETMPQCKGSQLFGGGGPDGKMGPGVSFSRYIHGTSSYWAILFWKYWLHTKDVAFLKETAWPLFRDNAMFFCSYMIWDEDNQRYLLKGSMNPELQYLCYTNPIDTLALFKMALKAAIQASEILGKDKNERAEWKNLLDHYPEYPVQKGCGFVPLKGLAADHINHLRVFTPIFPTDEIDMEISSENELACAEETLKNPSNDFMGVSFACASGYLNNWTGRTYHLGIAHCRMGHFDQAWKFLEDLLKANLKPNGLITHNSAVIANSAVSEANLETIPEYRNIQVDYAPVTVSFREVVSGNLNEDTTEELECREKMYPEIEGPALYLLLIMEMLCPCRNGILRLFWLWPKNLDVVLADFRMEGPALFSTSRQNGKVLYVRFQALEHPVNVKLINPWENQGGGYSSRDGKLPVSHLIEVSLAPHEEILLTPDGTRVAPQKVKTRKAEILKVFSDGMRAFLGKPKASRYYRELEKMLNAVSK